MSLTAQEAREISANNKERKEEIEKLIKRGENSIKLACERGRRYTSVYAGYVIDGQPEYKEVIEHFNNLGYKTKYCYGTNVFDVEW